MNPTAEQIQKINHFSKVNIDMCAKIASVVDIKECDPKEQLLTDCLLYTSPSPRD